MHKPSSWTSAEISSAQETAHFARSMKTATQKKPQHFARSQQNGERLPTGSPPRCATRSMPTGSRPRCATRSQINPLAAAFPSFVLARFVLSSSCSRSMGRAVAAAAPQQPRIFVAYGLPSALCYALQRGKAATPPLHGSLRCALLSRLTLLAAFPNPSAHQKWCAARPSPPPRSAGGCARRMLPLTAPPCVLVCCVRLCPSRASPSRRRCGGRSPASRGRAPS